MLEKNKTKKEQKIHLRMLTDCKSILDKYGIINILSGSALLGIIRDSDLIPWSPGCILIVDYDHIKLFQNKIIDDLKKGGFKITRHFKKKSNFKIRADKGRLNIEIVGYNLKGKEYYRSSGKRIKTIPIKYFINRKTIKFKEYYFVCPQDINGFLVHLYGDWKKVIKSEIRHSYKATTHTRYK